MSHPEEIAGFQVMLRDAYLEPMPVAYAPREDIETVESLGVEVKNDLESSMYPG